MTESAAATQDTDMMPARYAPAEIEATWLQRWLDAGVFEGRVDESKPAYSIALPPPNVTGALHMGHALNGSIQDALCRYKRMTGHSVLWQPGVDHAGIATQAVVEKMLRAEGTSRHDLGREKFLERVWAWKEQYGSTIISQYKRLGASLDYTRERFTMDEQYARAVQLVFVKLYEKGYIYRDNYLINWDAGSHSAISDLEVNQKDVVDEMVEVDYQLEDGSGYITISTARPETIPADVAVAVHPDDDRYRDFVGKNVRVPFTDRVVPVIADEHVDIEFGTGALKITPGHDPNDFEIGNKHGLERLTAINFDRTMTELAGEFAGMPVDKARSAMTDELEKLGVLRSREPYKHKVPHSERSGVRIEPLISLQWFCNMKELAKPATDAVRNGDVRFVPEGSAKIFFGWMDDIKPWCLSRQLWWGHQLPVWYRGDEIHVSLDGPDGEDAEGWVRDDDVLDTWFSSGLWDFATLGWPDDTPELRYFHPTSVLCTAREIINLWVARMMMLSYEFIGEKPFDDVYIHSIVQATDGRRMSKSLGTGVDPMDLFDEFGADATRYGLLMISSTQDVRFNEGKIREGRDLANKLWNASRLVATMCDAEAFESREGSPYTSNLEDRWILNRLNAVVAESSKLLENYDFAMYTKVLYSFIWSEFCDWYLELIKPRLKSEDSETRALASKMAAHVLDGILRITHPVMPHITEAIRSALWGDDSSMLIVSNWPTNSDSEDSSVIHEFSQIQAAVSEIRSLRGAAGVPPKESLAVTLFGDDESVVAQRKDMIETLANVDFSATVKDGITVPLDESTSLIVGGLDAATLRSKLENELTSAKAEVKRAEGKLTNERFVSKAPDELVEEERAKVSRFSQRAEQLERVLEQL